MAAQARIVAHIVQQHAEEAGFLWMLRDVAVEAPHYACRHLARLDERVEAHVDGLRVAGEAGWQEARTQLEATAEAPEMFAAAIVALEGDDAARVDDVVALARAVEETQRGLRGAVAWAAPKQIRRTVQRWMDDGDALKRELALVACSVHGADPGPLLAPSLRDPAPAVRARAYRLVAELPRPDMIDALAAAVGHESHPACAYWSAWALALRTRSPAATVELQRIALTEEPHAAGAFETALRVLETPAAMGWLQSLHGDPEMARAVVIGLGLVGDPGAMSWLIDRMEDPALARVAGEAVAMITGVDLAYLDLDGAPPVGFESGSSDDPADPRVAMDEDEHLPGPDAAKLRSWWAGEAGRFTPGVRHLYGAPISVEACERAWRDGFQRQRRAAALELARLQPRERLRNWRARVLRS